MKLLAISNPEFIPDEAELINSLFGEGLACLHIRKPDSSEDEFRALIKRINPEFLERISIHQHHQLAKDFGLKRLHFTEKHREMQSEETIKSLSENGFTLSTSIHDLAELDHLPPYFGYTFFGPVFDSISKSGYKSELLQGFCLRKETRKIQIIALGGIDYTNLGQVQNMNFDGAAILGTLWNNPKMACENFKRLNNINSRQSPESATYIHDR